MPKTFARPRLRRSKSADGYRNSMQNVTSTDNSISQSPALRSLDALDLHFSRYPVPSILRHSAPDILPTSHFEFGQFGSHRGMFIGEDHNERDTMGEFERVLPSLAGKLNVIFLEFYPKGASPEGKSAEAIHADMKSFNKDYGVTAAEQVNRICAWASKHKINVSGIDVPRPENCKKAFQYLAWRRSAECNRAFLSSIDDYAGSRGGEGISFCMYVGSGHLSGLMKLARKVPGYTVDNGELTRFPSP